jgi:hypothetical protein
LFQQSGIVKMACIGQITVASRSNGLGLHLAQRSDPAQRRLRPMIGELRQEK